MDLKALSRSRPRRALFVGVAVVAENNVVDEENSARHRHDEPLHSDQVLGNVKNADHHHWVQLQLGRVDLTVARLVGERRWGRTCIFE